MRERRSTGRDSRPTGSRWRRFVGNAWPSFLAFFVAVYAAEGYLAWNTPPRQGMNAPYAKAAGQPFDERPRVRVIADLRAEGRDAWPIMPANAWLDPPSDPNGAFGGLGRELFPLGGIANAAIVSCNETGRYFVYDSDGYGFNNPATAWDGPLDIALVGDSFSMGACVRPDESVAALLRRRHPRTASAGMGGNGPLLELATLTEYVAAHRPRVVVWMFYVGNDIRDLGAERDNPILRRYLEPGFSQGLRARQGEIDDMLRAKASLEYDAALAGAGNLEVKPRSYDALDLLTARRIRQALRKAAVARLNFREWAELGRILAAARDRTAAWGGRLHVAYLPSHEQIAGDRHSPAAQRRLAALLTELGIPLIDGAEIFAGHADPLSLFPFRKDGHYTPEGYRLLADLIGRVIAADLAPAP